MGASETTDRISTLDAEIDGLLEQFVADPDFVKALLHRVTLVPGRVGQEVLGMEQFDAVVKREPPATSVQTFLLRADYWMPAQFGLTDEELVQHGLLSPEPDSRGSKPKPELLEGFIEESQLVLAALRKLQLVNAERAAAIANTEVRTTRNGITMLGWVPFGSAYIPVWDKRLINVRPTTGDQPKSSSLKGLVAMRAELLEHLHLSGPPVRAFDDEQRITVVSRRLGISAYMGLRLLSEKGIERSLIPKRLFGDGSPPGWAVNARYAEVLFAAVGAQELLPAPEGSMTDRQIALLLRLDRRKVGRIATELGLQTKRRVTNRNKVKDVRFADDIKRIRSHPDATPNADSSIVSLKQAAVTLRTKGHKVEAALQALGIQPGRYRFYNKRAPGITKKQLQQVAVFIEANRKGNAK